MSENKVSIVVAAYNVEKYIDRCVNSLLNQIYSNIEVIIVNDASKDRTLEICKGFEKRDQRIIVVDKKENEGLSEARNSGLEIATGEYVTFVDGDDFLDERTIEECIAKLIEIDADELVFGSYFDRKDGTSIAMRIQSSQKYYSGLDEMKIYFGECLGSLPSSKSDRDIGITPWGRIYKSDVLKKNKLRFISERKYIYEDLTFFLLSTAHINSVIVYDKQFYHYCENEGSLTQRCDLQRYNKVKYMYKYIKENYSEAIFNDSQILLRFKRLMLSYIRLSIMQVAKVSNGKDLIKHICKDEFTLEILKDYPIAKLPFKQKIIAFLIRHKMIMSIRMICKFYC